MKQLTTISLNMLGTAQIRIGSNVLTPGAARRFALMLYLLNERHAPVPRGKLIELFLHDAPPERASHSLRVLLYDLRQLGAPLVSDADGVGLSGATIVSDYAAIISAPSLSDAQLETISAGFLPGYGPQLSEVFAEWLEALRARATFALSKVLVRELWQAHANEDWMATERIARVCLRVDPLHEEATLSLAEVLALGGAKAEAMRLLDRYIVDVGGRSTPLALPASVLRRRIAERLPQRYGSEAPLPFVGRDPEMAILADRLDRACNGESGCVVLLGDAGIGKTRIAAEFIARAALKGVRFVAATAQPNETHRPMGAFVDAVPHLLELPGALGCSPVSMSALERLTIHDPAAHETPVEFSGRPEEVAVSIARAIGDLVDAITSETPLILWLEDAHWLDEMSLQMATSLVGSRIARRLLVVFTTRERRQLTGHCAEHATTITVRPLPPAASHALLAGALAGRPIAADQSNLQWLVSTAAGNPFFLVSLLNHVERTGERQGIPSTISELLDQRIAALSREATNALEACVLLGKHATIERIVTGMELPHYQLLALLKELEDRRMIVKNGDLIQASHWLIADAVQRASSPIATALSHRRIAELLETEARATHSPALLWDCGEHWLVSGDAPKAIQTIRECSNYAVEIGRSREGAELLQRVAQMATGDLQVELVEESIRLATAASERDVVVAGVKMLRAAGVPSRHDDIEVAELLAGSLISNDTDETANRLWRCMVDPESSEDHRLQLSCALIVFAAQHQRPALATEAFDALSSQLTASAQQSSITALQFLLIFHTCFGSREEAVRIAREMTARLDLPPEQQVEVKMKAGIALWRCGDASEAITVLSNAFALAEKCGLARLRFVLALSLAGFCLEVGDSESGDYWLSRTEQLADAIPALRRNFEYLIIRTDIASARCDLAELQELHDAGQTIGIPSSNDRVSRWAFTLSALIDHLSDSTADPAGTIDQLTQHHRDGEVGEVGDFEVATALKISGASERLQVTRLRLKQYLQRHRTGYAPLSAMLQQVAAELEKKSHR